MAASIELKPEKRYQPHAHRRGRCYPARHCILPATGPRPGQTGTVAMSYKMPTNNVDFRLSGAPYVVPSSPVADFLFDGRLPVYFALPPCVVRPYQSDWQTATDRQQVCTSTYATSRLNTSRTQTSHQAQPLAATSLGLYWESMAKKETVVSVSHGQSREKQHTILLVSKFERNFSKTATNPTR